MDYKAAVPDQTGLTKTTPKSAGTCTYWPFWHSFSIFSSALPRGSIFTFCVGDLCWPTKNRDSFVEGSTDWVAWRAVLPRLRQPLWRSGCDLGDNLLVTLLQLGRRRLLARRRQRHCLRPGYQGVLLFSWMHCSRWFSCGVLLFPPSQGFQFFAAENFVFKVFPEAKVILTKRSSESWQKSMRSSLLKVLPHSRFFSLDFRHYLQAYENRTAQPYRFMLFAFDWRFVSEQGRVLWHLIF